MAIIAALRKVKVPDRRPTRSQSMAGVRRREALVAYLFIAPTFILFVIFIAWPMVESLRLSLFKWNIFQPPEFVGMDNYARLVKDTVALTSFRNTAVFAVSVVFLDMILALALAVALQYRMPTVFRYFFRTTFILPVVTSLAAISIILKFMLSTNLGVINHYLGQIGIERIPWLESSQWALLSIVLATVWKTFGFDLLLFTAGIQNIPGHLYEAADIDGASGWDKFRYITLPQLSPTIFFVIVIGFIGHLQMFDQARIMTVGGYGTQTVVMVIWDNLGQLSYGYGSTIATVFFVFILGLTVVQFWFSGRWVYYEGGGEDT